MPCCPRPRPRPRPRPAAESPEPLWEELSDSFQSLHCGTWPNRPYEYLYRAGFKLTVIRKGPWLLEKTSEWHADWLRQHLLGKLRPFAQKLEDLHSPLCGEISPLQREGAFSWVGGVVDVCDDVFPHYFSAIDRVADILLHINRAEKPSGSSSVHDRCLEALTNAMVTSVDTEGVARTPIELIGQAIIIDADYGFSDFHNRLRSLVVTIERSNSKVDLSSLMRTMYLDPRRQMYKAAAPVLVDNCSPLEFFKLVRRQLLREELCAHTVIPRSAEKAAKTLVLEEILQPHLQKVMNGDMGSLAVLFQNEAYRDLSLMYELISLVDKDVEPLKSLWRNWLRTQVESVPSENSTCSGVQGKSALSKSRSLDGLKQQASNIVSISFHSDPGLLKIMEETCNIHDAVQ